MRNKNTRVRVLHSVVCVITWWMVCVVTIGVFSLVVPTPASADPFTRTKVYRRFGHDIKIDVAIDGRDEFGMRFYIVNQFDPAAQDRQGVAPYDKAIDIDAHGGKNPETRGGRTEEKKKRVLTWRKLFLGNGPGYDRAIRLQAQNAKNQERLKKELKAEKRSDEFIKRNTFTGILKGRIEPSMFVPGDTIRLSYSVDQNQDDVFIDIVIAPYTHAEMLGIQEQVTTGGLLQHGYRDPNGRGFLPPQALVPHGVPLQGADQWNPNQVRGGAPVPPGHPNGRDDRFRREGGASNGAEYRPGNPRYPHPQPGAIPGGGYGGHLPQTPQAPYNGAPHGAGVGVSPQITQPMRPPARESSEDRSQSIDLEEEAEFERMQAQRMGSSPPPATPPVRGMPLAPSEFKPTTDANGVGTKTAPMATLGLDFSLKSGKLAEYSFRIALIGYDRETGRPVDFAPSENGTVLPKVCEVQNGKLDYSAQVGLLYVLFFTDAVRADWLLPRDARDGYVNGENPGWVVPEGGRRLVLTKRN